MVAKVLMDAGLYLGAESDMMPAAADNPEGFWENVRIVGINDALLTQLGGGWDLPPAPPADWHDGDLAGLRDAATEVVASFADEEPWGWKDPRNSLTIRFWQSVVPGLRHVFVVRNPLEVALSLQKRNTFSLALGLSVWYQYASRFMADAAPSDRLITHFDAYFDNPESEVGRLLAFADLPHDATTVARSANSASPNLKHHRLTVSDLVDAGVAPSIIHLYIDLCTEAGIGDARLGTADLVRPKPHLSPGLGAAQPETGVGRFGLWIFSQQQRIRELEVANAIQEGTRTELEGRIAERDGMVLEREARIGDRDARIAERDMTITRATQEIALLRQTIEDEFVLVKGLTEQVESLGRHELELREMLTASQDQLLFHDMEIMGTLGGALARVVPGAPVAIYYRQMLEKVRSVVRANLPAASSVLVANYGDDEFLDLEVERAVPFPLADNGVDADYTSVDSDVAITQLETLRARGAGFLVVPSPAQAWLARLPALSKHLERHYPAIVHDMGTCTIYALGGTTAA
jgi:hypothetical protein